MGVNGGADDGIRATTVATASRSPNSFVANNGNAVGENGLDYDNVTGSELNQRLDRHRLGRGQRSYRHRQRDAQPHRRHVHVLEQLGDHGRRRAPALQRRHGDDAVAHPEQHFQRQPRRRLQRCWRTPTATVDLTFNGNTVNAAGNAGGRGRRMPASRSRPNGTSGYEDRRTPAGRSSGVDGSAIDLNPIGTHVDLRRHRRGVTIGTVGVAGSGSGHGPGHPRDPDVRTRTLRSRSRTTASTGPGSSAIAAAPQRRGRHERLHRHEQRDPQRGLRQRADLRAIRARSEPIRPRSAPTSAGLPPALENDFAGQASGGVTDIAFRRPSAAAGAHLQLAGSTGDRRRVDRHHDLHPEPQRRLPDGANFSRRTRVGPGACQRPAAPVLP